MPAPPAIIRQAATLVALIGCALAIGPSRKASAAGCHVDDRPVFGLSTGAGSPTDLTTVDPAVVPSNLTRVDRHCPSESPERPSPRLIGPIGPAILATAAPIPPLSRGFLRVVRREARPSMSPPRIDRPPRAG